MKNNIGVKLETKKAKNKTIVDEIKEIKENNYTIDFNQVNPYFKKYVEIYKDKTETSPEFILTALLPAIASAIGDKRSYSGIYPNIWSIILGVSTESRKSTALNIGSRFVSEKHKRSYKENAENGNAETFLLPQSMSEAVLYPVLKDNKRGLFKFSEIKTLFTEMLKKHNVSLKAFMTDAFDVTMIAKNTKTDGEIFIEKPIFSLTGASTYNWIKNSVNSDDVDSGFLARFLFCYHKPTDKIIPHKKEISINELNELQSKFNQIYKIKFYEEMTMNEESQNLYSQFYREIKKISKESNQPLSLLLRIRDNYIFKFAMIHAVIDDRVEINIKDMQQALYLGKFFMAQSSSLLDELFTTETTKREQYLLDKIKAEIKKNKYCQSTKVWKKVKSQFSSINQYNNYIKSLVEFGAISISHKKVNNSQRPSKCIEVL